VGYALMATRGRKPVGERAATAAERKARFDKRMRNADGEMPGEPCRTPCVIYLSQQAREMLSKAREARRRDGQPQLLDSQLVELLLLAYDRLQQDSGAGAACSVEAAVERLGGPVLLEFQRLTEQLRVLERELISARGAAGLDRKKCEATASEGRSTAELTSH
jgi:hypothetical protein